MTVNCVGRTAEDYYEDATTFIIVMIIVAAIVGFLVLVGSIIACVCCCVHSGTNRSTQWQINLLLLIRQLIGAFFLGLLTTWDVFNVIVLKLKTKFSHCDFLGTGGHTGVTHSTVVVQPQPYNMGLQQPPQQLGVPNQGWVHLEHMEHMELQFQCFMPQMS